MSLYNTFLKKEEIKKELSGANRLFFAGIGGIGMSGLALLCKHFGYTVAGDDREAGETTAVLEKNGIPVSVGARTLPPCDALIYSLALDEKSPLFREAKAKNIPTLSRADLLGYAMSRYPRSVAVAGMHGKTTVTAMLAAALAPLSPTVLCGAALSRTGGSLQMGGEDLFVAEACEYKDSFLCLSPQIALVLNTEWEHPDYFSSLAEVRASFGRFLARSSLCVLPDFGDAATLPLPKGANVLRFGYGEEANVRASDLVMEEGRASFLCRYRGEEERISLSVLGRHNADNALAAAAAALSLGVPLAEIARALSSFTGSEKRLEKRTEWRGASVFRDYAHHPTEIRASLAALRAAGKGRLFCLFEPHTYSRTAALFDGFVTAFADADECLFLDIYAAREKNTVGVSSSALALAVPNGVYLQSAEKALAYLSPRVKKRDTVVFMGAGKIHVALSRLLCV